MDEEKKYSALDKLTLFCLENKIVVAVAVIMIATWGVMVAPFDWDVSFLPRDPVPVDAIPDIGENQQIVFTEWMGRSPQDVEDQITFPLTTSLLGLPSVRTVRSFSFFGFSSIYIIFKDDVDFYWSRSRVLEKLNSLPPGTLPEGVRPALGPDATALGQVYWYTLEGRDPEGNPTGGWDLNELRSAQDWQVRFALQGVEGVSEVASIGGYVQEYQVDVDPDSMRAYGVTLNEVFNAVRMSNVDVGARTIEVNGVEYMIRGLGFIKDVTDLERTVIKSRDSVPIYVENVATVSLGPALRRGALDKGGADAVGGVVVVRYGENPLATINRLKEQIALIAPGLPRKTLEDGTVSQVTIVPFYDRTGLINETLGTLNDALLQEILVTIIVVIIMLLHFRSSLLISGLLPLAVLMCFVAMRVFGVDANIVALSGIAIAIGTMVDVGIVVTENILRHQNLAKPGENRLAVVHRATREVSGAVVTAILTTVVSFLPVFAMEAAEGKLFKPLAFTKTFALLGSVAVALFVIPSVAHLLFSARLSRALWRNVAYAGVIVLGVVLGVLFSWVAGVIVMGVGTLRILEPFLPKLLTKAGSWLLCVGAGAIVAVILARNWLPLGPEQGNLNILFVFVLIGGTLGGISAFQRIYIPLLRWFLANKTIFLLIPSALVIWGGLVWLGSETLFSFVPKTVDVLGGDPEKLRNSNVWRNASAAFPGLGEEFMPPLDEGSFLYMPMLMPHASIGEAVKMIEKQDMAIRAIPEVELVVGKVGRVDSPLDPAPVSMVETIVTYKSEFMLDDHGERERFQYDTDKKEYVRDATGQLIPDTSGRLYRQWRPHIKNSDDIWDEIAKAGEMIGATGAAKLQPIATRLIMLQTGMRAPIGVKIFGPDLKTIEQVGLDIERLLKEVPQVKPETVFADRLVGKPYLEIDIDREVIGRYGMHIRQVQDVIEVAIGGKRITTTVEGRERYPVRVRYPRELRGDFESLERILVPTPDGAQIPLGQLARIYYRPGPQAIKSEDTFLVSNVIFDKRPDISEVEAVEAAQDYLEAMQREKRLILPAGVSYKFAGNYENQVRSEQRLRVVLPLAMLIIFLILYLQFRSVSTTLLVFSGILVAWAGGFMMLWFYGKDWFMNFSVLGSDMRDVFQIAPINLSVAVWVGFLALFGIATDNGVILATYLKQTFERRAPDSIEAVRAATLEAAEKRIRPCLMTSATTILALIPILTSSGRGSDVMIPMAIPSFGGMSVVLVTVFVVPVLYAAIAEFRLSAGASTQNDGPDYSHIE